MILAESKSVPLGVPEKAQAVHLETAMKDTYGERLRAALDAICVPSYPPGLIPWLGDNRPALYNLLVNAIPDTLHKLWSSGGPIEEFEASLATWAEAHREAIREFKTTKRRA